MIADKEVGELWLWVTTREPDPPLPYLKPDPHTLTAGEGIKLIRKLVEITTLAGIEAIEPRFPISLWAHKQRLKRALRKYGIPEEGWK